MGVAPFRMYFNMITIGTTKSVHRRTNIIIPYQRPGEKRKIGANRGVTQLMGIESQKVAGQKARNDGILEKKRGD